MSATRDAHTKCNKSERETNTIWYHLRKWDCYLLSHVWLFATPWTIACQASLPMEFSRQWCGVGSQSLLQGIFQAPRNFLHCRWILYRYPSHQGSHQSKTWHTWTCLQNKRTRRHREQTCGCQGDQGDEEGWTSSLGLVDADYYI